MKTDVIEREVNFQGDFDTKSFHIEEKNTVHIIKILRNKLYSNKILAVIREYITNAIDANVENKSERPIQITLPTMFDSYLRIRDFGKGLSQKEVENIFISYGNSTKRNSDDFTGCLGIGSKSAFSYADSFLINSYRNGKLYNYVSFLDETGLGSITLLAESSTEEESGLEICVPIKSEDHSNFEREFFSYIWAVDAPYELKGTTRTDFKEDIFLKEEGQFQLGSMVGFNTYEMFYALGTKETGCYVVMGNVPYKIESNWFSNNIQRDLAREYKSHLLAFKVKMGEVEFSSNRESIELTTHNQAVLKEYLERFKETYRSHVKSDFVNNSPRLNQYSALKLNIAFTEKSLDNGQGKIFNLDSLEFNFDISSLLKITKEIVGKGLVRGENSLRLTTFLNNKETLEKYFKDSSYYQSKFTVRRYPIFVLGTDKKTKDEDFLYKWKNTIKEHSDEQSVRTKFQLRFPGCEIVSRNFITGDKSFQVPALLLVYPEDTVTREEYFKRATDLGFGIIKIEDLQDFASTSKEMDSWVTLLLPKVLGVISDSWGRRFNSETAKEDSFKFLEGLITDSSKILLVDFKGKNLSSSKDIRISYKTSASVSSEVTIKEGDSFYDFDKFSKTYLALFGKVPIFVETKNTNISDWGFEIISFKDFQTSFFKVVEDYFKSLSPSEVYFYTNYSSGGDVEWTVNAELGDLIKSFGFRNLDSFKEHLKNSEGLLRKNPEIRDLLCAKNSKVVEHLKKIINFSNYMKKYSVKLKVNSQKREVLTFLGQLFKGSRVFLAERSNDFHISGSNSEYLTKLLLRIKKKNSKLLFYTNYIEKELNNSSYYSYGMRNVLDEKEKTKIIIIISNLI